MKITGVLPFAVAFLVQVSSATADIKADADSILNWGEAVLPALMSSHQSTSQFDNYWYRAYGNTDFYAAINSQDKGVYYGSIAAFLSGVKPTFYKSVADALKDVAASNPAGGTACDVSKMPPGFKVTQTGNAVKVTTDGCIPEPQSDPNYCPQLPKESGVSIKMTMNFSGKSLISCVKNASPSAVRTIDLDVCYSTGSNANKRIQGNARYEDVADCLTTGATMVTDLFTGEIWFNIGGILTPLGR